MAKLTICIPSRNERFLKQTVQDVLAKARGDVAVYAMLDGYDIWPEDVVDDPRLTYIRLPTVKETRKRHAINQVVGLATGQFVMSLDAHCLMAEGFDVTLAQDYQEGCVLIPRRNRLDAENWCIQVQQDGRPPIDYEHTQWPLKFNPPGLHGFRWDERTHARAHLQIDDTMHFQGSCWFMSKTHFQRMGFMQIEGYSGWGQEAEEIALTTLYNGGQVLTDKNTWYAHLHKGPKYGRMYWMSNSSVHACNKFAYQLWVYERRAFFEKFIERFWPVPGWPRNWHETLYSQKGQ